MPSLFRTAACPTCNGTGYEPDKPSVSCLEPLCRAGKIYLDGMCDCVCHESIGVQHGVACCRYVYEQRTAFEDVLARIEAREGGDAPMGGRRERSEPAGKSPHGAAGEFEISGRARFKPGLVVRISFRNETEEPLYVATMATNGAGHPLPEFAYHWYSPTTGRLHVVTDRPPLPYGVSTYAPTVALFHGAMPNDSFDVTYRFERPLGEAIDHGSGQNSGETVTVHELEFGFLVIPASRIDSWHHGPEYPQWHSSIDGASTYQRVVVALPKPAEVLLCADDFPRQ